MEITREYLEEEIKKFFKPQERTYKIYTGTGGMELFEETWDKQNGYYRVYIGKKNLRMLRFCKSPIKFSRLSKRYYKLLKTKEWKSILEL